MATVQYLAMTSAEMEGCPEISFPAAWMACHFSPYGLGLSNLPRRLPPGSLLMLDDITPIRGHDPRIIREQLCSCLEAQGCSGILLDFQRSGYKEAADLAGLLAEDLPCPVCVSSLYAQDLSCPVLVPPVPCHMPLKEYLLPWEGREIWLELSAEGQIITLTETGAKIQPCPLPEAEGFREDALHCHYKAEAFPDAVRFTLWRTPEDQASLLAEAKVCGIGLALGLYQEFPYCL